MDRDLSVLLASVASACKQIAALVRRAPVANLTGLASATNASGDEQKKARRARARR